MSAPLPPGSIIGILGGGQLGRMLALAGARLGFDMHVYDPEPDCPASRVAARSWCAPWEDAGAVESFAARCDAVTYEFENVPEAALEAASRAAPVRPGARSLALTQDRVTEKDFVRAAGIATVDFAAADTLEALRGAVLKIGTPALLKTRRLGYDGKGQAWINTAGETDAAWAAIGGQSAILEAPADFVRELSVVAARGADGAFAIYPLSENVHGGGILRETRAPASVSDATRTEAEWIARAVGDALDHTGVFAVELFERADGRLLLNEIAPRVHNTGHWTMDACSCDQFEQHVRAVALWPLGDPAPHSAAVMTNLIGADVETWAALAAEPGVRLHLYGKREAREGRKMGHVTRLRELEA